MSGLLRILIKHELDRINPKPVNSSLKSVKPEYLNWLPLALEFIRDSGGAEVTTKQIHEWLKTKGKVPLRFGVVKTLNRAMKDGRAPNLENRIVKMPNGFHKVCFWRWRT